MLHKFKKAKAITGSHGTTDPNRISVNVSEHLISTEVYAHNTKTDSEYALCLEYLGGARKFVFFDYETDAIAAEKEVIMLSRHVLQD